MKIKFLVLVSIFSLTIGQTAFACDCDYNGTFLELAPKTKLVALVKVKKYLTFENIFNITHDVKIPMSMKVEIIEIYRGKERRKTVKVWGDSGNLCRPYLAEFELDKYYVIAFYKGMRGSKEYGHKKEKKTDYSISICGEFWLDVDIKEGIAKSISSDVISQTQISLTDLKTKFNTESKTNGIDWLLTTICTLVCVVFAMGGLIYKLRFNVKKKMDKLTTKK